MQRSIFLVACFLALPAGAQTDCTTYERSVSSIAPIVVPSVSKLKVRTRPSADAEAIASIARGHNLIVTRKCGDWIEVESDHRVAGEIESFTGWVHFPLTCTPRWRVRGDEHLRAGPLIAPECPFE